MFSKTLLTIVIGLVSNLTSKEPFLSKPSSAEFAVPVNYNSKVYCTKSIQINARPEVVWQVLTSIDSWSKWQKDISKAHLSDSNLKIGAQFKWTTNGATINSKIHTVTPNLHLGWTGKTIGVNAIHNWKLDYSNGLTKVPVEESLHGWLTKLFRSKFQKDLETGMDKWLLLLKKESESKN